MRIFKKRPVVARVALNMVPKRGPYGGGNQWLAQMHAALERVGYAVQFHLDERVDCVVGSHAGLGGGLTFSYEDVARMKERCPRLRCIQRINDNDVRKGTQDMDAHLAECSRAADHVVFVSEWLRDYHAARWFDVSRPHSVIRNGADPWDFHPVGGAEWKRGQPLRLVTHHWSDNPSKGFDLYARMDELIASGELPGVELWVIGRWPAGLRWRAARTFAPCAGADLAGLLRQCHVYVTASRFEPGAMHPVEGLQCGLPLLYHRDSGGTVETGRVYGIEMGEDLAASVRAVAERYGELRAKVLAAPPSGDWMCVEYRRLVQALLTLRG